MTEKRLIVNNLELHYEGIFGFEEFLHAIMHAVEERGYHLHEKRHEEHVTPEGKSLFIELRPMKKKIDYYELMLKIRITLSAVRETTIEVDGIPTHFQEGKIHLTLDGWATTDYKKRWGHKPVVYFLKSLIHKYVYRFPLEEGFVGELVNDVKQVRSELEAHLNLYRYRVKGGTPHEEEGPETLALGEEQPEEKSEPKATSS